MHRFKGIARSPSIQRVLTYAQQFAIAPRPVLINGERGTGKELVARFIHDTSPRANGPFQVMNCAAFNDELVNSEMYGHAKGAFTGAHTERAGKLAQADTGSLFMDEIGNMSPTFQEGILRVLEYQRFEPVGSGKTVEVDVRIISATNADLDELMNDGLFRRDLYDRLSFAVLKLPPLRNRRDDIPHLVVHFVHALHQEIPNLVVKTFEKTTVEAMMDYYWPGNIRELKNVVERVYLYGTDERIQPHALPPEITGHAVTGTSFHERVEAYKRQLILTAADESGGNQRQAAEQLNMSYDQFRHYYRKFR